MNGLTRLPGYAKEPPGLEMEILRLVPRTFLVGTLLIAVPSLLARALMWREIEEVKLITTLDHFALGVVLVLWTALITVTFGAVLVHIMKGPAYVGDAYALSDAETPFLPCGGQRIQNAPLRNDEVPPTVALDSQK